jgi:hypothetical protein
MLSVISLYAECRIFGKIALLRSFHSAYNFCLVLFQSRTLRPRLSPFSETQMFANLAPFEQGILKGEVSLYG